MLPENPLESGTKWKCDKCSHQIDSSSVTETVSTLSGEKWNVIYTKGVLNHYWQTFFC